MRQGKVFRVHERLSRTKAKYCETTGEYREPKQGEFFISGATPGGYMAYHDMTTKYYIAKLIR